MNHLSPRPFPESPIKRGANLAIGIVLIAVGAGIFMAMVAFS